MPRKSSIGEVKSSSKLLLLLTAYDHILGDGATEVGGAFVGLHQLGLWHHKEVRIEGARAAAAIAGAISEQSCCRCLRAHMEEVGANAGRRRRYKISSTLGTFLSGLT